MKVKNLSEAIELAARTHEYVVLSEKICKNLPFRVESYIDTCIMGYNIEIEHIGLNQYIILIL